MTGPHLLSIDQGTSSSRAILFSADAEVVAVRQKPIQLYYPQAGWVEQNPDDILNDTIWALKSLAQDYPDEMSMVAACGITNQRETTILWNRKTGRPIYNAVVWQDRRTAGHCEELRGQGVEELIGQKTGLLLDAYFSATKIAWILDNVDGARKMAMNGDILFGTVDCFLLWHLTGGALHATDATNASRTMLYNIKTGAWDEELLAIFGVPESILPGVRNNVADYGRVDKSVLDQEITIGGMAGDQQAALIGQGCVRPGMIKSTYGTGCFALLNTGGNFMRSQNRLLTTIAYSIEGDGVTYALEGSIFNAGTAIQFLRDNFGFFDDAAESEILANSVDDTDGAFFVPSFTGLGAPFWTPEARGIITGLQRSTTKAHITRAALEAQAYQTRDLISAMRTDAQGQIDLIRADGGLVANAFMCQFIADILGCRVEVPAVPESTAWGAACLAGVQAGIFGSLDDTAKQWKADHTYQPLMTKSRADALYKGWQSAVQKSI